MMIKKGFTLIELLVVVAIMGMMGIISVGAYRSMKRGIEERGVMQTVQQFVQNAYLRARIDRVPTAIYFWNETRQEDSDDGVPVVFGRAVAVRRMGRITRVDGNFLVDEFGDLREARYVDEEGEDDDSNSEYESDVGFYLYKCNGNESSFARSIVSQTTVLRKQACVPMVVAGVTYSDDANANDKDKEQISAYGYYIIDKGGVSWTAGDGYALQFDELDLPENYTFGSYDANKSNPVKEMSGTNPINFDPKESPGSSSVQIYAYRPNESGQPTSTKIGTTESAKAGN